jgi:hypothetical protein
MMMPLVAEAGGPTARRTFDVIDICRTSVACGVGGVPTVPCAGPGARKDWPAGRKAADGRSLPRLRTAHPFGKTGNAPGPVIADHSQAGRDTDVLEWLICARTDPVKG